MLLTLFSAILAYVVYLVIQHFYKQRTSPIQHIPGPPPSHWLTGNLQEILDNENSVMHDQWVEQYGPTIKYRIFLTSRLYTVDTKAINHIFMNEYIYQKPAEARAALSEVLGNGVLVTEMDQHKFQRKVMNPAFGPAQIRQLNEIFIDKAIEMRDVWKSIAASSSTPSAHQIDVLSWLSRMTLDVIGLAGFNYEFSSLSGDKPSELNEAFSTIFSAPLNMTPWKLLLINLPIVRLLPTAERNAIVKSKKTMDRIGEELLKDAKKAQEKGGAKDLLSLLVQSNQDQSESGVGMSDEDVLAQIPTFLVAGHETTSTAVTWAIYLLTLHPDVQKKLYEELLNVHTDHPTMDDLNALPYLDKFVRETLRISPPVPSTTRVAVKDDVLPMSDGTSLPIKKGQTFYINILGINRNKNIWGEDAGDFKPDRWDHLSESVASVPGVWGNMLTFIGGPRSCIGYRFSLVEMKALLYTLVRAFEFELPEGVEVKKKTSVVQRPLVNGKNEMPVLIKTRN